MPKKQFGEEIGAWSELKLEYVRGYLGAYSNILKSAQYEEYCFIDGFAGSGTCRSKTTKETIRGSPLIALSVRPPFSGYFFIELDEEKAVKLEQTVNKDFPKTNVEIIKGDCNTRIDSVLEKIEESVPFVALLDPQAGDLYFQTIRRISQKKKAEVLINFPFGMAIRRYMTMTKGGTIGKNMRIKLDRVFGSTHWKQIYLERRNGKMSSALAREKYLDLYLDNLLSAGFKFYAVKNVRNSLGNHIYYLIFGSKHIKGLEKMKDVIARDDPERDTLFFLQDLKNRIYQIFNGESNLSLCIILEKMLSGKHPYKKQDFKTALMRLEKEKRLKRVKPRENARSFQDDELFNIS